jgi:hypothetical protein
MVAYHKHENYSFIRHTLIPAFGLVANLVCMGFYIYGPAAGYGTPKEPRLALGIAAVWALYGIVHLFLVSRKKGKSVLLASRA